MNLNLNLSLVQNFVINGADIEIAEASWPLDSSDIPGRGPALIKWHTGGRVLRERAEPYSRSVEWEFNPTVLLTLQHCAWIEGLFKKTGGPACREPSIPCQRESVWDGSPHGTRTCCCPALQQRRSTVHHVFWTVPKSSPLFCPGATDQVHLQWAEEWLQTRNSLLRRSYPLCRLWGAELTTSVPAPVQHCACSRFSASIYQIAQWADPRQAWEWPNAKFKAIASNRQTYHFDLFIEQNTVDFSAIQSSILWLPNHSYDLGTHLKYGLLRRYNILKSILMQK